MRLTETYTSSNALRLFVAAIFTVGVLRFGFSVAGVNSSVTRFASMTIVILAAGIYFGCTGLSKKAALAVAYILIAPYMVVEVAGLGFTWWTGTPTIFHSEPYTLGTSIRVHFWGHVIGGSRGSR